MYMQGNKLLFLFSQLEQIGADVKGVVSCSRKRKYHYYRVICVQFLRNWGYTYKEIGEMLGGRDHSSMVHLNSLHKDLMDYDDYKTKWEQLRSRMVIEVSLPPNYAYKGNQLTNVNITHDL